MYLHVFNVMEIFAKVFSSLQSYATSDGMA